MPQLTLKPRPRAVGRSTGRWCRECGYTLQGLPVGELCPECGHSSINAARTSAHSAWSRSVSIGLALILLVTLHAVSSVLIQPFTDELGGTAPALNLPAPKLWAMPLLQRPIGQAPEMPGVVGTRTAILSLIAIWLITAPCASPRLKHDQTLRQLTRWTSVGLFGLAFGAMMASHDLWPRQLPPFRLILVACVELPGTLLLYLYLRKLSQAVPGRDRRGAFDILAWAAPLAIFVGAIILSLQWLQASDNRAIVASRAAVFTGSAIYGCIAMLVGVAATASIGSLLGATFPLAFPQAFRLLHFARGLALRGLRIVASIGSGNANRLAVAGGLVLLLIAMVIGNDRVSWMSLRQGLGGNLPFVNFPGPKMWLSTVLSENFGRGWEPLMTGSELIILNLLAAWLVTIQLPGARPRVLRQWVRWLPVICVGAGMGTTLTLRHYMNNPEANETEFFAAATAMIEVPATLLLYAWLAHLAETCHDNRLGASFRTAAVAIVALVATSLLMCVLSKRFLFARMSPAALGLSGLYGAASLLTAVWTTTLVVRLIGRVLLHAEGGTLSRPRACIARNRNPVIAAGTGLG